MASDFPCKGKRQLKVITFKYFCTFVFRHLIQACVYLFYAEFKVVDRAEESFIRRITVNEDITKRNSTIEVHLTSIDMLVTVRVDTVNKINSITTTYLPGKTGQNEVSILDFPT